MIPDGQMLILRDRLLKEISKILEGIDDEILDKIEKTIIGRFEDTYNECRCYISARPGKTITQLGPGE